MRRIAMTTRRTFLKSSAASAPALSLAGAAPAVGRLDKMAVALVGCGGMGMNHLRTLVNHKLLDVTHLCDVDSKRLADAAKIATDAGHKPKLEKDLRKVLEDNALTAVWMAT